MVRSMTAFARAEEDGVAWEIRSVNHRYLDANFRLPDSLRAIEPDLRVMVKQRLHRGKVECQLRLDEAGRAEARFEVNDDNVLALKKAIDRVSTLTGSSSSISPLEVLRWPGVIRDQPAPDDALMGSVEALFAKALDALATMREREGRELGDFISSRLDEFEAIVKSVREEAPAINQRLAEKIRERLDAVTAEVDNSRLEQELVYLTQKADILEELDRLDTHIEEIRHSLAETGPMGRRLDFLMQELNREANTLSSKTVAANTSLQAVELKVLIEQMREQIQNIE